MENMQKFMKGQISPMETGKKDVFGAPTGEKDMTDEEARKASDSLDISRKEESARKEESDGKMDWRNVIVKGPTKKSENRKTLEGSQGGYKGIGKKPEQK